MEFAGKYFCINNIIYFTIARCLVSPTFDDSSLGIFSRQKEGMLLYFGVIYLLLALLSCCFSVSPSSLVLQYCLLKRLWRCKTGYSEAVFIFSISLATYLVIKKVVLFVGEKKYIESFSNSFMLLMFYVTQKWFLLEDLICFSFYKFCTYESNIFVFKTK